MYEICYSLISTHYSMHIGMHTKFSPLYGMPVWVQGNTRHTEKEINWNLILT